MKKHLAGSIALIDGLGALFVLALLVLGLGFAFNGIEEAKQDAMIWIELEGLRSDIRETVAMLNITACALDDVSFEVGSLRFSSVNQEGSLSHQFFMTDEGGVRIFYITAKG